MTEFLHDSPTLSPAGSDVETRTSPAAPGLQEEWTRIYKNQRSAVYRLALYLVRNSAEAEDITQEAFLRLLSQGSKVVSIENTVSWVNSVVRNLVTDRARKKKFVAHTEENDEIFSALVEPRPNAEEQLVYESRIREVNGILENLSEQERQCAILFSQGQTYRSIAESLNIPYWKALDLTKQTLQKVRKLAEQGRP